MGRDTIRLRDLAHPVLTDLQRQAIAAAPTVEMSEQAVLDAARSRTGLDDFGWLARFDWQFHWHNRGWPDFDGFLGALTAKKRKNIRHERARVARAGIACEIRHGDELDDTD